MVCPRGVNCRSLLLLPLLGVVALDASAVAAPGPVPVSLPSLAVVEPRLDGPAFLLASASRSSAVPGTSSTESLEAQLSSHTAALGLQLNSFDSPHYLAQVIPSVLGTQTHVSTDVGGNRFEIDGGTQVGGNLFHRFEQFDLTTGQVARFLSNSTIASIFSQVTGPASSIDGLLQVSGSGADLFLINPAGILLGPNAKLDLSGSFTATTASRLGFGEQWIDLLGEGIGAETEIAAPLTVLEFSGDGGAIANQGRLAVAPGESIGLLGHAVVNTGSLEAPGGQVTLAAAKAGQRLSLDGGLLNLDLNAPTGELLPLPFASTALGASLAEATSLQVSADGMISLEAGTAILSGDIDVSALDKAGGQVKLLGESVRLVNSVVDASGHQGGEILVGGNQQGQGTLLRARQTQVDSTSALHVDALGAGDAGQIIVWADDATQFSGTITATAQTGEGGFVETSGKRFLDVAGARVDASSLAGGSGDWLLDPTDILIQVGGGGSIAAESFDPATTGPASVIAPSTIENALDGGTNVTITTAGGTGGNGDITLNDPINQTAGGSASFTLTGRRFDRNGGAQINLTSTGGLTFNLNQVNGESNPSTQSIQTAIDSIGTVNGPRLITLGPGSYVGLPGADLITIDTDLTLDGLDRLQTFISGSNNARVVAIAPGTTATLQRLNIQDGQTAASGAGILNQGNLSLIDVLLQNNIAGLDGGAIDSSATNSSLTTGADTVIANNQAGRNGGGLVLGGNSQIEDGGIIGNVAGNDGGGVHNTGVLRLSRLGVSQNAAAQGGGVANVGSTASTTIQSFAVRDNDATGNGGGIFNDSGTLATLNGSFDNNTSGRSGGGLFSSGPTSMLNTGFDTNQAAQAGGGAFLFGATADLQALSFQNNQAAGDGGGLRLSDITATLSSSDFLNNQADFGGGLEASGSGSVTLNNVTFLENVALRLGGALQNDDSVVLVANEPIFDRNRADLHGGAVHNNSSLTINDGLFIDNSAVLDGGGIRNFSGQLTLNQGTFRNNTASRYGGAIHNADRLAADGVTFETGQAVAGGAIFSQAGQNVVTNSLFDRNVVSQGVTTGDGGGIYSFQSDLFVGDSTFRNNQAEDFGGAIVSSEGDLSVVGAIFQNNSARIGGGLHQNVGELAITDSQFLNNQSQQQGGGLNLFGVTNSQIQQTLIQANQVAAGGGGGITLGGETDLTLERVSLFRNLSARGAGLDASSSYSYSGTLNILNSAIANNQSTGNGGGIDVNPLALGGDVEIANSTISGNTSENDGGGIAIGANATFDITNSTLALNQVNNRGGGIAAFGTADLTHVTATDNQATGQGGGLFAGGASGQIRLTHTIAATNQAPVGTDVSGNFDDQGNNLIGNLDGTSGFTNSTLLGSSASPIDPLLAPLDNYGGLNATAALLPGSVAIDAGSSAIAADQRGVARVNAVDIGAFESQGFVTASPVGTPQSTEVNTAFPQPLAMGISSSFGEPVDGGQVEFAAPASSASIASNQNPIPVTITGGVAQLSVNANGIVGEYNVEATAVGVSPVVFELTNLPAPDPEPPLPTPDPPAAPPTPTVEPPPVISPPEPPPVVVPTFPSLTPEEPSPVVEPLPVVEPPPVIESPVERPSAEPVVFEPPALAEPTLLPSRLLESPSQPLSGESPLSLSSSESVAKIDADFSAQYTSYWHAASTEDSPVGQSGSVLGGERSGNALANTRELLDRAEAAHGVKSAVVYALFVPQDKANDERFGQTQVASMALRRRQQTDAVRDDDLLMLVLVPSAGEPVQRLMDVTRQEVMQQVRLFRMAVADPEDPWSFRPLAQQIQSWLFAPIEPDLERLELDNTMYALAPGLRAIPLAAMMDGDEFVIERYGISLIPSVDLLETDFGSSPPPPQTLVAGANEFEQLADLPAVELELNAIANQRESVDVLFNQEFTKANLIETQKQGQAKMLHLATHGSFNAGDLGRSYLQFWDGQLTLDEISQMGWNDLELLILSACQTAINSPEAELGFAGLAAAAGVESTIGSLWTVSDIGTLGMMAEFYGQLNQEPLRFEALRQTQLSMIRGETAIAHQQLRTEQGEIDLPPEWQLPETADFSHPFYWSGFTLVGNPWW